MPPEGKHLPYDRSDRQSVYHYAVEAYYFMLDLNNESKADFKEAGLEL